MELVKRKDLIYPDLSYKIIGVAYKVFNELSWGQKEVYYQRAFALELNESGINFQREKSVNLNYQKQKIGKYILDFIIDDKIVVELKVRPKFGYIHIHQVLSYLKNTGLKLAIIIYFTKEGVKYRRIINN